MWHQQCSIREEELTGHSGRHQVPENTSSRQFYCGISYLRISLGFTLCNATPAPKTGAGI
ncbi:hypothetical protein GZ78_02770 [Endozoicomonas numazuensis]|uniref:Uncharacterized protein n=1 Tax=Endozoicomonas numazuensis TaxID=1137799 RepID=A0A081NKL0_9GAMM|nr:hypothetical protein GZ78_02770 [Endozoicomonas numazuensis]